MAASEYQQANRMLWTLTDGRVGMRVVLDRSGFFWSRGWRGCPDCGGSIHEAVPLQPFSERRGDEVRSGFRCRAT